MRTTRIPLWRRVTLRDVIFFTLPPMLLALWVAGSAVLDYQRIRQFDDWWSNATSVRKFAWYRVRSLLRTPEMTGIAHRLSPEAEDKPLLRLRVAKNDWNRIDSDVGGHWGEWVDATIVEGNDLHDAELRFRGDGSVHWTTEKKSFTLKTKRRQLYNGFVTMAFTVKDVFPQWLVGTLANDFDLLAPEQDLVPVYLNERFYGLHRFVEPVDESFLRRHVRLPGNVFRADTAERGDYFKGLPREVFMNPFIWDRVANNDRPGAIGTKALGEFIADINDSTYEGWKRLADRTDGLELARLFAFLLIVGDPYHMSGIHNQFWYEDPSDDRLHPIVWDVRLLDLTKPPHGANINRFWRAWLKEPFMWQLTMSEVAKWLADDKVYKLAEARVNAAAERFKDELAYDNLRAGVIPPVGTPQETLAVLRKNLDTLKTWTEDYKFDSAWTASTTNDHVLVLDLQASGRAPVYVAAITVEFKAGCTSSKPVVRFSDSNENGVLDADDAELSGDRVRDDRVELWASINLSPGCGGTGSALVPIPTCWRLFIDLGDLSASEVTAVSFKRGNPALPQSARVESAIIPRSLVAGTTLPVRPSKRTWSKNISEPSTLAGQVHLTSNLIVSVLHPLTVEPGTTLTLDPNVSILLHGRAQFKGTEAQPITIQRSNPDLPWGVVAVQGEGANGSQFEHVKFLGGGGGLLEDIEYTGSICVHNATGVVFDHCEIAANSRCDDLIHVDRGDVALTNSWLHDANADSIDYDMSSGLVAHNKIERSGNDGLDLMTCWPRVIDNEILNSGDKGISIGEDSTPFVFDNKIHGCERGIEVKDRSQPIVLHNTISGCKRGVYAHLKNWRYGEAGWPKLVGSIVANNEVDWLPDDGARRTLVSSQVGELSDELPQGEDLAWLYALQGIATSTTKNAPGLLADYTLADPIAPLFEGRFEEDFVELTDGWKASKGVTRLHKRAHDLVANLGEGRGAIGLDVDWDLSDAGRKYVLVLEIASEGVSNIVATATSPSGDASAEIELANEPTMYRYATVELSPRRYNGLMIAATPTSSSRSRVSLHTWRVVAWPATSGGK